MIFSHRRRANIAGSTKGEHDMEEKQIRMLEHKVHENSAVAEALEELLYYFR